MNPSTLILEDNEFRIQQFRLIMPFAVYVKTAAGAIERLGNSDWDVLFLDHDLGDEIYVDPSHSNTGSEVVRWIAANKPQIGKIVVHTLNAPAGQRMAEDLREAGYAVYREPFDSLKIMLEEDDSEKFDFSRPRCRSCDGTGLVSGDAFRLPADAPCPTCNGTGRV